MKWGEGGGGGWDPRGRGSHGPWLMVWSSPFPSVHHWSLTPKKDIMIKKPLLKLILNFQTQFHTFPNNNTNVLPFQFFLISISVFVTMGHQSHSSNFVSQTVDISLSLIFSFSKLRFLGLFDFWSINIRDFLKGCYTITFSNLFLWIIISPTMFNVVG